MPAVQINVGGLHITREYPASHRIWNLGPEKRERKAIADTQRDLIVHADGLVMQPLTVSG